MSSLSVIFSTFYLSWRSFSLKVCTALFYKKSFLLTIFPLDRFYFIAIFLLFSKADRALSCIFESLVFRFLLYIISKYIYKYIYIYIFVNVNLYYKTACKTGAFLLLFKFSKIFSILSKGLKLSDFNDNISYSKMF